MFPPSATPPSIAYYNISGKFFKFACTPQLRCELKKVQVYLKFDNACCRETLPA